jgi:hypothetical protein
VCLVVSIEAIYEIDRRKLIRNSLVDYELVILDMIPDVGLTWRGNPNELIAGYAVGSMRLLLTITLLCALTSLGRWVRPRKWHRSFRDNIWSWRAVRILCSCWAVC